MMTRFRTLAGEEPLENAVRELLAGSQQDFPVTDNGAVQGILRRKDLVQALANGRRDGRVSEVMNGDCRSVALSAPLDKTLERMTADGCSASPVMDDNRMVGLLTLENIAELVMVKSAAEKGAARSA